MADNNSQQPDQQSTGVIYDFRWLDQSNNSYTLTPIPIVTTIPGAHQLNQGVAAGNGVPTHEVLSDSTSAGMASVEKGFDKGAKLYPAQDIPLGTAAKGLNVIGMINDGINVGQHLIAERYREMGIEIGGALGQSAGATGGAAIANTIADGIGAMVTVHPLARIGFTIGGAYGGARALGELGKDVVRHFTAPELPDNLDLAPHLVADGTAYTMVRIDGKVQWYQINTPTELTPFEQTASARELI